MARFPPCYDVLIANYHLMGTAASSPPFVCALSKPGPLLLPPEDDLFLAKGADSANIARRLDRVNRHLKRWELHGNIVQRQK